MHERLSVVTRKGQITLPARIRQALGIKRGDKVAFALQEESESISVRPVRSVADLTFGAVPARRRPEDFKKLRQQFMEDVALQADRPPRATKL